MYGYMSHENSFGLKAFNQIKYKIVETCIISLEKRK